MKKIVAFFFSVLASAKIFAQNVQDTAQTAEGNNNLITINGEGLDSGYIWKTFLVLVFSIVIIILVLRTFRGKAEV